jgi:MFS family permease
MMIVWSISTIAQSVANDDEKDNRSMNVPAKRRLRVMMALVYAVQGAWWPLLAVHLADLGISGSARGLIFSTMAIAACVTPFLAGQIVDRRVETQRALSFIYLTGAGLLVVFGSGTIRDPRILFALMLVYWLLTVPGYGLSNSLTFRNLERPREEFGGIRLWGTVGWLVAGWGASLTLVRFSVHRPGSGVYGAFLLAAAISFVLGVFCLFLPKTPPLAERRSLGDYLSDTRDLIGRSDVRFYLIIAFTVSLTTPLMYQIVPTDLQARGLPRAWIATAMTLGQIPEILALAFIPFLIHRCGYRGTLALGILAWSIRYACLWVDPPLWPAIASVTLHGVATACFTVGGQMYLDHRSPPHLRAGAQALNVMTTTGLGSLCGGLSAGVLIDRMGSRSPWIFAIPCVIDAVLFGAVVVGFARLMKRSSAVETIVAGANAGVKVVALATEADPSIANKTTSLTTPPAASRATDNKIRYKRLRRKGAARSS